MSNFTKFTVALVVLIIIFFIGVFVIDSKKQENSTKEADQKNAEHVTEVVSQEQPKADKIAAEGAKTDKADLVSKDGDTVTIDYIGVSGGKEFEGGTASDYDLTLGSGTFIDGFEEQLVGHKIGDLVQVDVTFPENYSSTDLAGQRAIFVTTIKDIKQA